MKKALALVLALVLALSMAVSAFALTLELEVVPADPTKLIKFVDTFDFVKEVHKDENIIITNAYYGGDFYTVLKCAAGHDIKVEDLDNIKVVTSGNVEAELVDYNPETMVDYIGTNTANKIVTYSVKEYDGTKELKTVTADWSSLTAATSLEEKEYSWCKTIAKELNKLYDTTVYRVVADNEVYVVKFSVDDNFSASYTEGEVKVTADCDNCKKAVALEFTVINDVSIFGYEPIKEAALFNAEGEYRHVNENGYSDFYSAIYGYVNPELILNYEHAEVISKTAFRAIEGKNITVVTDDWMSLTIKNVAKGQAGLNLLTYGDNPLTSAIEFGFENNKQKVNSEFVIKVDLGLSYFQLREHFLEKIEEDDIVEFYLIKDGKVIDTLPVDFMTEDYNEEFIFEIKGNNATLGQYKLDIVAPVAAEGEENPNTGAESVVGVVAALAVVSVATAAAVSLKK